MTHRQARARRLAATLAVTMGSLALAATPALAGNAYENVTGTFGSACPASPALCPLGEFNEPTSVAVNDETGDVYVLDSGNDRIEWFNSTGTKPEGQFNANGEYEVHGTKHTGAVKPATGAFLQPGGIAVDNDASSPTHGNVYVADVGHDAIDEFNAEGKYEGQIIGGHCENEEEPLPCTSGKITPFTGKLNVAIDPEGNLWIYDGPAQTVYEFSDAGELERVLPGLPLGGESTVPGFAVDSLGDLYVAEGDQIVELEEGTTLSRKTIETGTGVNATLAIIASTNRLLVDDVTKIELFGEPFRTFPEEGLSESAGLAVDGATDEGSLYATERLSDNVDIFNPGPSEAPEILPGTKVVSTTLEEGQFEAVVNPNNLKTTVTVEYSNAVSANGEELEGTVSTLTGEELPAEFGESPSIITGAQFPQSTGSYYYRVVATNSQGTTRSKVFAYTKIPLIAGEGVLEKTSTSATLQGTVNPVFFSTKYSFEYAASKQVLEEHKGTVVAGKPARAAPEVEPCPEVEENPGVIEEQINRGCPVTAEILGLEPGHTYYYRFIATSQATKNPGNANKGEPARGPIAEAKPYAKPAVSTGETLEVTGTTATLFGEASAEGAPASYVFAYISKAGYLQAEAEHAADPYAAGETTLPRSLAASETTQAIGPVQAGDLRPGTVYDYALVVTNQYGAQTIGPDRTFRTAAPALPGASTGFAGSISQTGATLTGTIATNGLATSYAFEVGTEPGVYGAATGFGSVGGNTTQEVNAPLTGLAPGTTYYFRLTATNNDGTVKGQPQAFTTVGLSYLLTIPPNGLTVAIPLTALGSEPHTTINTGPPHLTNKQKLDKALEACRKDKRKKKRASCEHAARKHYPVTAVKKKR